MPLNFEDVFCSKVRLKILKLLSVYGQLHTSDIAVKLNVNYNLALEHLVILVKEEVIEERFYGRTRYFRYTDSRKSKVVTGLFDIWQKKGNHKPENTTIT